MVKKLISLKLIIIKKVERDMELEDGWGHLVQFFCEGVHKPQTYMCCDLVDALSGTYKILCFYCICLRHNRSNAHLY